MPESTIFLGEVPLTPYGLPSTPELAEAIIPALQKHDALLLENHGALSCGHTLESAWFKMEALDYYAKVVYLAANYGGPKEFTQTEIDRLVDLRRTPVRDPGPPSVHRQLSHAEHRKEETCLLRNCASTDAWRW